MDSARWTWALAGVAAAAAAIGVAELGATLIGGSSIIAAVGSVVIALQPPGAKDLMVALFGTNDKAVLEIMVGTGGLLVGALLGLASRSNGRTGLAGFAAFGVVGLFLVANDPLAELLPSAIGAGLAVLAGMLTLTWLSGLLRKTSTTTGPEPDQDASAASQNSAAGPSGTSAGLARRSFLALGAMVVAIGALGAFVGRLIGSQAPTSRPPVAIPPPAETLGPIPAGTDFALDGLTPIVVPNEDFYRIDTALTVPRIDAATWSMRVHGMVERELTLTYADLLAMPLYERYVTIACVSNEVGGYLVGNAKWTGVSLVSVLEQAGVRPEATQLVGRSYSWTCGFPTAHLAGAGSEAMIALQMNGEPLPAAHGFPARLIVPGLYGYVSATKWLTDIEMTTLDAFDAYWVPLGWSKEAPILTQSRIDLPRHGSSVAAGSISVAGVAWAPTRRISGVEVQVDDGAWLPAQLSVPLSDYSWVQWRVAADLAAGGHTLRVRATDGTGATQAIERTTPAPDGARGYHEVRVNAS